MAIQLLSGRQPQAEGMPRRFRVREMIGQGDVRRPCQVSHPGARVGSTPNGSRGHVPLVMDGKVKCNLLDVRWQTGTIGASEDFNIDVVRAHKASCWLINVHRDPVSLGIAAAVRLTNAPWPVDVSPPSHNAAAATLRFGGISLLHTAPNLGDVLIRASRSRR